MPRIAKAIVSRERSNANKVTQLSRVTLVGNVHGNQVLHMDTKVFADPSRRPLTATQIQSYTMSHVKSGRLDSIFPVRGHGKLDVVASFFDGKLIISFGLGKGLLLHEHFIDTM
jgi:hypothetical protein